MLFEAIVSSLKLTLSSLAGNLGLLPPWGVQNEDWSLPPPSSQPSRSAPSRRLGSGSWGTFAQRTLKLFLKKKEGKKKRAAWLWLMMLTSLRNPVVCRHNDSPSLLTNIPDPLLGDCLRTQLVVLWLFMGPKEVFHTTQITNLTVPLSRTCLHWSFGITWLGWCRLSAFFFFF